MVWRIAALVLTGSLLAALPAQAEERWKKRNADQDRYQQQRDRGYSNDQRRSSKNETMEDIRANSTDPSGNHRGLPNWARAAFPQSPNDN